MKKGNLNYREEITQPEITLKICMLTFEAV